MFSNLNIAPRQMLTGNMLMIFCCIFYLLWWLIAFHPTHAIKGFRSGWLLIPAFILGVFGLIQILRGSGTETLENVFFTRSQVVIGAVIAYVVLLIGSYLALRRPVTTELLLIVGWTALMFIELNAFYGLGDLTQQFTILLLILTVIAAAVSLFCYLLYYNLNGLRGYIDGLIPLILIAVMMALITILIVVQKA